MSKSNKQKNKVYFAEGDPDYGGMYIAAKNGKEAKLIAMGSWVAEHLNNPYIELKVARIWFVEGTDYEGELNIFQINELGLTWWACEDCDQDDFEIINAQEYKCKNCEEVHKIPYI